MNRLGFLLCLSLASSLFALSSPAQTAAPGLPALTQKIEEQNTKIDALSQQILKLQQEIEQMKGGAPTSAATESASAIPVAAATGPTHVVSRGETLTSIAKQHKVGIEELQKFNHIENDRKLQIGQTLLIPGAASPAPAASPNE